jgi:thiol-disulfide isomerase/thioredoxin
MMRLLPLSAALSALLLLCSAHPAVAKVRRGDRAAAFVKVVDEKGRRVSLKSYRDKVVVLTFGASWCAPCKRELPALEKLAGKYDAKKVAFLAVNIDSKASKGKKFMAQAGLRRVRALYDSAKSTVDSYDPPKMPSIFIIRRGIVKYVHMGYRKGDEADIAKAIDKELK